MSRTFTKLFASITESTIWVAPDGHRLVWITMLAMADQHGRVWGSVPGLANRARVPVDVTREALASFLAPDPDSRTKDHKGRRIEEIEGGWRLLNHSRYRGLRDEEERREQNRVAQARSRTKKTATVSKSQRSQPASAQAEASTKNVSCSPSANAAAFETFWTAYPRRVGRKKAEEVFASIAPASALVETMLAAIKAQGLAEKCAAGEKQFIPYPTTWLREERWLDEANAETPRGPNAHLVLHADEQFRAGDA